MIKRRTEFVPVYLALFCSFLFSAAAAGYGNSTSGIDSPVSLEESAYSPELPIDLEKLDNSLSGDDESWSGTPNLTITTSSVRLVYSECFRPPAHLSEQATFFIRAP